MWLNERDQMLAEKDGEIRELREQVQSLRRGDGPIGEVVVHNWPNASAESKAQLLTVTRPVNETLKHLDSVLHGCADVCRWGRIAWFDTNFATTALEGLIQQRS